MNAKHRVITNNDIAYIWWSVPNKITDCLGFSIHREVKGQTAKPLPAWVGFDKADKPQKAKNTDVWPIQSFQWKDTMAPREGKFRYLIYAVKGSPDAPKRAKTPLITTDYVELQENFGKLTVVFNRGLLSTQALSRGNNAPASNARTLRQSIGTPTDRVRKRLTRELLPTIKLPLTKSKDEGGTCYCALYELTDEELITELENTERAEVILSNANSSKRSNGKDVTVYDGTNKASRARLRKDDGTHLSDRLLKGNSIGHNKFVIYENGDRKLEFVLTGSTNWTPTGLCGQTNNALLIEDEVVATHYLRYWKRLRNEQAEPQGQALRTWARENPLEISLGNGDGDLKIWFSPNTKRKTKPKTIDSKAVPVDMKEVFEIINGAQKAILFLLFNPGKPSIIDEIEKAVKKREADSGQALYIRGAISDPKTAKAGSVKIFDRFDKNTNKIKKDTIITGVGAIPDDFGYWEKELLKLGHAAIHDKVLVVDPFSKDCTVVTGSHNLGYKASYSNDENMVIIRGNQPIAEAFAAHVLDVVNHYKFRYRLQEMHQQGDLEKAWQDLEDDDKWQDKYFDGFLASRDHFVLDT